MAKVRIFVSSTCYDLHLLRSELRPFIVNMGYEPVMSDYSDILYDPRTHTHDSCIKEVPSCDMVVLIIGSRVGGKAAPSALDGFDFSILEQLSTRGELLEYKDKLSITQLEVLKAIERSIPVYTFVTDDVMHDHHVYEKNKDKKEVMAAIEFPSIQKRENAQYIFEFINFLGHRVTNNSITPFSKLDDIKLHLSTQWSHLFQRMLFEARTKATESRRYQDFTEQLADLKVAIMTSISSTPNLRETARGAIEYRQLITFLLSINLPDTNIMVDSYKTFDEIMKEAGIVEISEFSGFYGIGSDIFLIKPDRTFYRCKLPLRFFKEATLKWGTFLQLPKETRAAIIDALSEDVGRSISMLYIPKNLEEYLASRKAKDVPSLEDFLVDDPAQYK